MVSSDMRLVQLMRCLRCLDEVPWIFEGTLRENIITKSAMHQERQTLNDTTARSYSFQDCQRSNSRNAPSLSAKIIQFVQGYSFLLSVHPYPSSIAKQFQLFPSSMGLLFKIACNQYWAAEYTRMIGLAKISFSWISQSVNMQRSLVSGHVRGRTVNKKQPLKFDQTLTHSHGLKATTAASMLPAWLLTFRFCPEEIRSSGTSGMAMDRQKMHFR